MYKRIMSRTEERIGNVQRSSFNIVVVCEEIRRGNKPLLKKDAVIGHTLPVLSDELLVNIFSACTSFTNSVIMFYQ